MQEQNMPTFVLEERISRLRHTFLDNLPQRLREIEHALQAWMADPHGDHLEHLHLMIQRLLGCTATFDLLDLTEQVRPFANLLKRLLLQKQTANEAIQTWMHQHLRELVTRVDDLLRQTLPPHPSPMPSPGYGVERQVFAVSSDDAVMGQFAWEIAKRDHQLRRFDTPASLVTALQEGMPAGLLIDLDGLPVVEDFRIVFEGKFAKMQSPVPVIVLSSEGSLDARLRAVRLGGNTFARKPVNVFKLTLFLTPWLRNTPLEPYRVLLVDDDEFLTQYYQIILSSAGFDVAATADPSELLEIMAAFQPELVVLDLYLPGCNGVELASVIRQHELYATLPILFLSAEENLGRRLSDQHLAYMDHLLKPVYPTALIRAVSSRIKQARAKTLMEDHLHSALQELENFQFALNQHAIISATDVAGRITYINDKFCETSGYLPHELIGQNHRLVKSGFHSQSFYKDLWDTITSGRVWHGQIKNRRKDGTFYWVEATVVPFLDDQGRPREFISIRTEITRQKQAEEQARSMAFFAEMNPAPVLRVDSQGNILEANPAAVHLLGAGHHPHETLLTLLPDARRIDIPTCIQENKAVQLITQVATRLYQFTLQGVTDLEVCHLYGFDISDLEAAREALQEAKESAENLINSSLDMIISVDTQHRITQFNPAAERTFGFRQQDVLGKTTDFLYADPVEREKLHAITWLNGEFKGEIRCRRKNGELFTCYLASSPLRDKQGHRIGYMSISRDITERKIAEEVLRENEQRIRAILESTVDGIIVADERGYIELFNAAAERIFGYQALEVMGSNLTMLMPPHYAEEHDQFLQNYLDTGLAKIIGIGREVEGLRKNGERVPLFLSVSEFRLGDKRMFTGVVSDITSRKQAEMDLRMAKEAAEKASRAKSEFLSSMSHELRTPLNAVLGFSQLLESDPTEPLTDSQTDSVREIIKAGQHLLELINEVLDLAKIEAGKVQLTMEEVSLREIIDECLSLVLSLALKRGIVVEREELLCFCQDILVLADRVRLKQVLLNLMSNAIKYNREHGRVTLRCELQEADTVKVMVQDTGVGIAEEKLPMVFEPFNRLGAEHGEVEGTGIGLVITKRLMEYMGGALGVTSQLGKGSTFHITLKVTHKVTGPAKRGHAGREFDELCELEGKKVHTLLYVEDNPANLKLVERLLQRRTDFRLLSAPAPALGLEIARSKRPDAILLDINLPGMSGYEVLRRLRQDPETRHIPVIAISANAMREDVARGLALGFQRYLTKPLDVVTFMETLDDILAERLPTHYP